MRAIPGKRGTQGCVRSQEGAARREARSELEAAGSFRCTSPSASREVSRFE
jgi:hypothetical protein